MAEITSNNKHEKGKRKVQSTRVDLTPMVDLGFLLITFFVFTTTMNSAKAMKLLLPADTVKDSAKVGETGALTLIADEGKVYYYTGMLSKAIAENRFRSRSYNGADGIRNVIIDLKKSLTQQFGNDKKMFIMLKGTGESTFKSTIDLLDEMTINKVVSYALMEVTAEEQEIINKSHSLQQSSN